MNLKKLSLLSLAIGCGIALIGCSSNNINKKIPSSAVLQNNKYLSDSTPRLAIIAAFGQEADLLLASLKDKKDYIIQGKKFTTGLLENKAVVITLSGISMTNAAMTTQLLADHFNSQHIIFSGIAGSLNPNYHVGDVVIVKSWIAPNEIFYANNTQTPSACGSTGDISCLGLKLDQSIPPYKTHFFRQTNVINSSNYQNIALTTQIGDQAIPVAYGEMKTDFSVDPTLLNTAARIQNITQPSLEAICANKNNCYQPKIIIGERGVSSGSFLANSEYRDYLHNQLKGDCVDMETAAVAQVAYANNIPFIAFRSLSDLAGADHDPNVGAFFSSGVAQRNAAKVTIAFIKAL
ncbi:5'-methylthioadenosine/S-adenosylhomocysteine nucleosidase [Acinetobacter rathckeae]|uniref:5'-methylthioadenosine/S-adenosylhomocysteine nucleosidase n=1 Tax=Acinetobacter rathckeae TaxID=2605272 RepID=UPI0018A2AADF|nr:5'-methylthioadenosine/S-adenosylhomocysteine nucleosidase [Acinetobacter rathckeae]MBF7689038.1 5'-methylthioadenosine/S-adenosylhomocysteine nucleosidase [Acinetobacter rathckeae]MBF7696558.1 5'-methylthioadenosine/S-adenosylhomocysteine nucleosidase [Acinetobacter rathckeae]